MRSIYRQLRQKKNKMNKIEVRKLPNSICQLVENCEERQTLEAAKPKEPHLRPQPEEETKPMQMVGVDVFHVGNKKYLALVDYYSSFIYI